jgi:fumarate reductase subunit C
VSKRKPYVRSMDGWWKKNPYFVEYMIHESTALFVAAYCLVLLVGVIRLGQGEAAWNGWLEAMKSPLSVLCHLVLLAGAVYHTYSWFKILPITMPPVIVGGKKMAPEALTGTALAVAAGAGLALLALVWRIAL